MPKPCWAALRCAAAGAVAWVRGLAERMQEPWAKLQGMKAVMETEEGRKVRGAGLPCAGTGAGAAALLR
jgi:hypothetical protein